jgi:hypothetical protein
MKQIEDQLTMELPEMGEVITRDNSLPINTKTYFRFYVKGHDGLTTEWCGLTRKQARDMYAYTDAHQPSNVVAYGWEEVQ